MFFVVKTLEDERYGVITAYKLAVFGDFEKFVCISIYCVSALSVVRWLVSVAVSGTI